MDNEKMVFNIKAYGKSVTIEVSDDLVIYDFLDHCRDLALSMGYDMETWKTGVIEMAEHYMEEEQREVEKNLRDYGSVSTAGGSGITGVTDEYLRKTPKTYTGKSGLTTTWQDKPSKEYVDRINKEYADWVKKNIHDSNC
jgi:hypothetical protein